VSDESLFIEAPRIEWFGVIPFAFARLDMQYARSLEASAHRHLKMIDSLPSTPGGPDPSLNFTGARYASYNVFLLGPEFLPLFHAIHRTYRALLDAIESEPVGRFIKCWFNITDSTVGMDRHSHSAPFIGTFAARAEGTTTSFGMQPQATEDDVVVENLDGQLLLTIGMNHFHGVSKRNDVLGKRVTYAFDIVSADQWRSDRIQVPFD
jgi:hypothetical protein